MRPRSTPSLALLVALSVLPACQSGSPDSRNAISTGLNVLADDPHPGDAAGDASTSFDAFNSAPPTREAVARLVEQSALDLEQVLANQSAGTPPPISTPRRTRAAAPPSPAKTENLLAEDAVPATSVDDAPSALSSSPTPPDSLPRPSESAPSSAADERSITLVASQLAAAVRRRSEPNAKAIPDALALATLESLRPGLLTELDNPQSAISKSLSPDDRRDLLAARDRVAADPNAKTTAGESLTQSLHAIAPPSTLTIAKSTLCSRVQGFGRYDALHTDTFIAGKPIRTLIYTELDGFSTRPARPADPGQRAADPPQSAVELSQSLTLYHDPSGLPAWQRPPQTIIEPCRTKRRDFFLVQRLELPATLSIGKYNLKIRVTDLTSGSEAESILPINVVTASGLTRR